VSLALTTGVIASDICYHVVRRAVGAYVLEEQWSLTCANTMESDGLVGVVVDCRDHGGLAASGSLKPLLKFDRAERVDFRVK
jgi:hypothetical protein